MSSPLLLLAALPLALNAPETAADHAAVADRQYADGFFAAASASYASAFELEPLPEYLYGWAQSERRAGNCPRAVELYREYVAQDVSEAAREAAQKNALRCGANLDEPVTPAPAPEPAPEPEPEPDPTAGTADEVPSTSWKQDAPAISLLATGGAIAIVAGVLGGSARNQRRRAERADVEADYAVHIERSTRLRTGAIVCATIGSAAIVGGIVRYVLVARANRQTTESGLRVSRVGWRPGVGFRF